MRRLAVMMLWVSALMAASAQATSPLVIVLSWDGVRHDFPDRGKYPALARMQREGMRAQRLTPVFPSNTFPGHVSLATGTFPDVHGIVNNRFIDKTRGLYSYSADADWIDAEPLWIAAERQGVKAATYFWVGSETDWRGQRQSYREAPFDGSREESAKVASIIDWIDLPEETRPGLIMSYWAGADHAVHRFGPDSTRIDEALAHQDAQLQLLINALDARDAWRFTTLMVVSDHGATAITNILNLPAVLADADVDATLLGDDVGLVYLNAPSTEGDVVHAIEGLPVRVLTDAQLRALRFYRPDRTGDVVLYTEPPHQLQAASGWNGVMMRVLSAFGWTFGGHGYLPDEPDMGAVFLAMGRGVPAGAALSEIHQTDVAPTVARLLGIDPPAQSEGVPVPGLIYAQGEPDNE